MDQFLKWTLKPKNENHPRTSRYFRDFPKTKQNRAIVVRFVKKAILKGLIFLTPKRTPFFFVFCPKEENQYLNSRESPNDSGQKCYINKKTHFVFSRFPAKRQRPLFLFGEQMPKDKHHNFACKVQNLESPSY